MINLKGLPEKMLGRGAENSIVPNAFSFDGQDSSGCSTPLGNKHVQKRARSSEEVLIYPGDKLNFETFIDAIQFGDMEQVQELFQQAYLVSERKVLKNKPKQIKSGLTKII